MKLSTSTLQTITALAVTLLSAACGGGETGVMEPGLITHAINPTEIVPRSAQLLASGEQTYETQCLACHGPEGNGEGEAAYLLYPGPATSRWGAIGSCPPGTQLRPTKTCFVRSRVACRGSGMPSWAHLSEETRWGLVHYIKRFTTRDFTVKPGSGPPSFGASGTGIIRVPPEPPYTDDARARANELYVMGCAPCHGDTGTGDGPQDQVNSKGYPTRPRDLTAGIANALAAVTGDQRFSDMFKFENEGRRSIYLQRLLDSSTTTSGFKVEDLMAGKHGPPGGALLNFRTYPRVPFYEQVHDDEPFHTDTGRLNAYSDIPEAIEYGENFIVHREGPEATPYLPNVNRHGQSVCPSRRLRRAPGGRALGRPDNPQREDGVAGGQDHAQLPLGSGVPVLLSDPEDPASRPQRVVQRGLAHADAPDRPAVSQAEGLHGVPLRWRSGQPRHQHGAERDARPDHEGGGRWAWWIRQVGARHDGVYPRQRERRHAAVSGGRPD